MKLTKQEQRIKNIAEECAYQAWVKWQILDALSEAFFAFEDCDESGFYMCLLDAHYWTDELEAMK